MTKVKYIANACISCYQDEQEVKTSNDYNEIIEWIKQKEKEGKCHTSSIWEYGYDSSCGGRCYQFKERINY